MIARSGLGVCTTWGKNTASHETPYWRNRSEPTPRRCNKVSGTRRGNKHWPMKRLCHSTANTRAPSRPTALLFEAIAGALRTLTRQRVQCPALVGTRTKQSNILCSNVTSLAGVVLRQGYQLRSASKTLGDVQDTAASKTSRRLEQCRAQTLQAVANSVSEDRR